MDYTILFRTGIGEECEREAAKEHFDVVESRCCAFNQMVIPRYSSLPYYDELEKDLYELGKEPINSYKQHKWIANFEWYHVLKDYTFETYFYEDFFHNAPDNVPYVVKGVTNSKKFSWKNKMFAENKTKAYAIAASLRDDSLIGNQDIIFRRYRKLKTYEFGANGLPFAAEWRIFFYKNEIIDHGYYWSIATDIDHETPQEVLDFACKCANIASEYTNFYVLDVCLTDRTKECKLVEINCGTMSGLSCIPPRRFYRNLRRALDMWHGPDDQI